MGVPDGNALFHGLLIVGGFACAVCFVIGGLLAWWLF